MEYEYLEIEVVKKSVASIHVKVPKDWRPDTRQAEKTIAKMAAEIDSYDWDDYGWEKDVEVSGYRVLKDGEAYDEFNLEDY